MTTWKEQTERIWDNFTKFERGYFIEYMHYILKGPDNLNQKEITRLFRILTWQIDNKLDTSMIPGEIYADLAKTYGDNT